jgi:lipopolysaccharide transport system ATP-binding protein
MSDTVIRVENLSKLYRLGEVSTGTISHDLNRWWHQIRGKEDPYALVGQVNDRTKKAEKPKTEARNAVSPSDKASDYVYALKDINFEVKQGEVLGIIGRNGAGKSTLLKILSRVTAPSSGSIKVKGRIASLLEVGTGFHPELTGRENIYLNGAILGMRRHEINSKLDEIVDFSGCAAYIDTPVKRYSSGMYVRLAFAVAANLEPEILILDEVLAVGDAEFQRKCLKKMNDVASNDGRTILFVSHNMAMITALCSRALLLKMGMVASVGLTREVLKEHYASYGSEASATREYADESCAPGDTHAKLLACYLKNDLGKFSSEHDIQSPITVGIKYKITSHSGARKGITYPQINLLTASGEVVFNAMAPVAKHSRAEPGVYIAECSLPANFFNNDSYHVSFGLATSGSPPIVHFYLENLLSFTIREDIRDALFTTRNGYGGNFAGVIRPTLNWHINAEKNHLSK